jgi:ABC-type branched-subunit amino acid transport system ATPase component
MRMSTLLHCEGLSKRFGGLQAVQQVGFSIARGELVQSAHRHLCA